MVLSGSFLQIFWNVFLQTVTRPLGSDFSFPALLAKGGAFFEGPFIESFERPMDAGIMELNNHKRKILSRIFLGLLTFTLKITFFVARVQGLASGGT
jgi:hypothetical protein